jgi:hypothetical protein
VEAAVVVTHPAGHCAAVANTLAPIAAVRPRLVRLWRLVLGVE